MATCYWGALNLLLLSARLRSRAIHSAGSFLFITVHSHRAVLVHYEQHAWEIKKYGQIIISECLTNKSPILNYLGFNKGVNAQYLVNRVKKGDACVVEAKSSVRATPHQQRTCICFQRKAAKAKQRPPPLVTSQVNIQRNNTNKMKLAIATLLAGSAAAFNVKEVRISSLLIGRFFRAGVW